MAYTKYSLTPANNTAAPPDGAPEGMLPSAVNDTMRDMMAQIRDCGDGVRDGTYTMTAPKITGGTITGVTLTGNTFSSPVISGGTINNATIGATTASTGAFTSITASTTLGITGVATFSAGTVALPAITTTGDTNTGIFFPAADTIAFTEGGAEAMRIDSAGLVGIGTSSPSAKLHVDGTGNQYSRLSSSTHSNFIQAGCVSGSTFHEYKSVYRLVDTDAGERMRIDSSGNVLINTTANTNSAKLKSKVSAGAVGFEVTDESSSDFVVIPAVSASVCKIGPTAGALAIQTAGTERMRIDSSGNLLVGTTSVISSGFTTISYNGVTKNGLIISESADTSGTTFLGFNIGATNIGNVSRVGATSAVIYNTTSDQRLKSNIADASPVLDKLMDVKVRQFDWTVGDLHQEAGFIAQELEPVLSGIVTKGKTEEDMWQMDYSRLTPYLVKAIQEQQALIESLTTRLTALENK